MVAKAAVTMPGKVGDILWTLPTARAIADIHGPVDFFVMDHFNGICPLINEQHYVNKCEGLADWIVDGNHALQNPIPPSFPRKYDYVYNLAYQTFPREPLVTIAPMTAGVQLTEPVLPFLEVDSPDTEYYDIVFGFSVYISAIVEPFIKQFTDIVKETVPDLNWIDGSSLPWLEFAKYVNNCGVYVGDKTGMHVIAHGLNKPAIIETEGNAQRRERTFCCPYNNDNVFRIESSNHFGIIDLINPYAEAAARHLNGKGLHE